MWKKKMKEFYCYTKNSWNPVSWSGLLVVLHRFSGVVLSYVPVEDQRILLLFQKFMEPCLLKSSAIVLFALCETKRQKRRGTSLWWYIVCYQFTVSLKNVSLYHYTFTIFSVLITHCLTFIFLFIWPFMTFIYLVVNFLCNVLLFFVICSATLLCE